VLPEVSVSIFVTKRTRERRSFEARLAVFEAQHELFARDQAETEKLVASLQERVAALEAERERTAPCPK
jgi:hypothetical protein